MSMYDRLEWDRMSVYPYDSCNIQELLCKIYSELLYLKEQGVLFDPKDWNQKYNELAKLIQSLSEKHKSDIDKINETIIKIQNKQIDIDLFGADPTGKKDSSEAIQKAIDFCNEKKIGELYIPAGKYKVTETLITKELKLVGLSKPIIPNPIGFDYAFPRTPNDQYAPRPTNRGKYLEMCSGSIISGEGDYAVFGDGLIAENLGIFGTFHNGLQDGISQQYGGPTQQIVLEGVSIVCCGGNGISAPYGLISSKIRNCYISQNGGFGIYIGKDKGPNRPDTNKPYTGETNNLNVEHCVLNRNTRECIWLDVLGRVFNIQYNEMEHVAYQSDMNINPPDHQNLKYACVINMEGQGGFGTGNVLFHSNYSESSQGLLYVKASGEGPNGIGNNITVTNNLWNTYNQNYPNSGVTLGGNLFGVTIWDNKLLGTRPVWAVNNIQGIVCNSPLLNYDLNDTNTNILSSVGNGSYTKFISNGYADLGKHPKLNVTGIQSINNGNNTRIFFKNGDLTNDKFGINIQDDSQNNILIGNAMQMNSRGVGYVINVSTANSMVDVSKPYDVVKGLVASPSESWVKFIEVGGLYLRNSDLDLFKCVPDSTGGMTCIKKNR